MNNDLKRRENINPPRPDPSVNEEQPAPPFQDVLAYYYSIDPFGVIAGILGLDLSLVAPALQNPQPPETNIQNIYPTPSSPQNGPLLSPQNVASRPLSPYSPSPASNSPLLTPLPPPRRIVFKKTDPLHLANSFTGFYHLSQPQSPKFRREKRQIEPKPRLRGQMNCAKCQVHNKRTKFERAHKLVCEFENCTCHSCMLAEKRRRHYAKRQKKSGEMDAR